MTIDCQLLHSMNIFNYIIKLKSFMTIQSAFREGVRGTSICKTETTELKYAQKFIRSKNQLSVLLSSVHIEMNSIAVAIKNCFSLS